MSTTNSNLKIEANLIEKTVIEVLIKQNQKILEQSKLQGEQIRKEFKAVNEQIMNFGQLFAQMNLLDKNLLSLMSEKTISNQKDSKDSNT